ncbi:MAG: arylesterase [Pseudomonadota bacterium]
MTNSAVHLAYSRAHRAFKVLVCLAGLAFSLFVSSALADESKAPLIVAFGDSLTAGYGLEPGAAFPNQLEAALQSRGFSGAKVHNAGVSGDTSSGGRSRLSWNLSALGRTPDLLILELGANDALRGLPPERTKSNLVAILEELERRGIPVLLTGMMAPPNLGDEYGAEFNGIYPALAAQYRVPLYPFFLDGVAADPALNQDDGMHPTREGVAIIVEKILPDVLAALDAAAPALQ